MRLPRTRIRQFRRKVWSVYQRHGRTFAWRRTRDPYRIAVSEVMLQQTQAVRVEPKFRSFVRQFPNWRTLARAPQRDVLRAWSGLGYNRRALALQRLAREVAGRYDGRLPRSQSDLEALPGIGPATAAAIRAFAFNEASMYLDTNVRAVFLNYFFSRSRAVRDQRIVPLIEQTLVKDRAREWYCALLDYGAWLKATVENPSRRSAHHTRQSAFEGSRRQLRGRIITALLTDKRLTSRQLATRVGASRETLDSVLADLERDGFILRGRQIALC